MSAQAIHDSHLPSPQGTSLLVDVRGAEIIASSSDDPDVYLPHHEEFTSIIAVDIGGSLAKVVYFTRPPVSKSGAISDSVGAIASGLGGVSLSGGTTTPPFQTPSTSSTIPPRTRTPSPPDSPLKPNGVLGPKSLHQRPPPRESSSSSQPRSSSTPSTSSAPTNPNSTFAPFQSRLRRRSSTSNIPSGGRLNFVKFETTDLDSLIDFLNTLITSSARENRVNLIKMKKNVRIMATGGGAHKFYERLRDELGVEVKREEEMECLVLGLGFVMEVPNEVFWYSDELVQAISHPLSKEHGRALSLAASSIPLTPSSSPSPSTTTTTLPPLPQPEVESDPFPRPSPNPPQYSLRFDTHPTPAQFPCLLVNIGSGVSIIKVDDYGKFERISGTSLGGGTLWGLLSLLTGAKSFDDMLSLADQGDNSSVDMLVGDIYGQDYQKIGLKSSTIASSFGKVFRKGETGRTTKEEEEEEGEGKKFKAEDISRSLLYAISNNIGQIAYMNAEKHNLDRIYFGGGFIRGHAATISTLSYAIRFWSKGTKKALFLRHEGYLGGIGAWLKNLGETGEGGGGVE